MKRDCMETRHNVSKKRKTEQGGTNQTVVGRGCNIGKRHDRQLQSLISLIPSDKSPLQVTEDRLSFLQQTGSCMGIYMEWLKKKDSYFLWGSSAEEGLMIKFEFHGGFEAEPTLFDIKNPLLGFSGGFNSDNWRDVKRILLKVFGLKGGEKPQCEPDYLLAFTRTGEILHLRVFKIHQLPSSECKNQSMKLQDVSPVFILKPLEVHYRVTGGSSEEYTLGSTFFDENRFMFAEGGCLNLDEQIVYSGGSSQPVAPHVLHNYNSLVVLLPLPASPRWIGFNTSCKEFFERYHIVKNVPVPGKGAPKNLGTHLVYTLPMRSFMRTLIMEVGEAFDRDCCFSDFTEDNVFLRRGKAAILGVKQVRYTPEQARRNWQVIFHIFANRAPYMPEDLYCSAFKFIASVACRELGEVDPRSIYHKVVNSIGWMDGLDKDHLVCDLYVEFLTFLDPSAQLAIEKIFQALKSGKKNLMLIRCCMM